MKRVITLFLAILWIHPVLAHEPVLYGERDLQDTELAVFFDEEGTLYPDYLITDFRLLLNHNSLKEYYKNNPADFITIAKSYNLNFHDSTDENIMLLEEAVLLKTITKINSSLIDGQSATFLIHGFRKPFNRKNGDTSSTDDFKTMEDTISSAITTKFIRVYWDGNYELRASVKGAFNGKNRKLLKLFEATQRNAEYAGNKLKRVIAQTKANTINVVSHSLGARVVAHALLNVNNPTEVTPSNNEINILLVAPAIGGGLFYDNYDKRNSSIQYTAKDNYNLAIVYNEKDFVLRKRVSIFGPGAFNLGDTSLGCNKRNRTIDFARQLSSKFPNSRIVLKDLTDEVRKNHFVKVYFKPTFFQNQLKGILK